MSIDNVKQFQQRVLQDLALQDQLKEATDAEQFAQLAVKLGKETGYAFTVEQVKAVSAARQPARKLSQKQIETVAPFILPYLPLPVTS
jgi:predicted ribosomally synthesized peptide with nif11-like leader